MKRLSILLTMAALMLAVTSPTWANLVTNPGFESGGTNPTGWGVNVSSGATSGYITSGTPGVDVHTGSRAVYLQDPMTTSNDRWFLTNPSLIPVTEGQEIEISFWVKTENLDADDQVILRIAQQDATNTGTGAQGHSYTIGNTDWTQLTRTFTITGATTTNFRLLLLLGYGNNSTSNATAQATFDDVSVTQVIPEPASAMLIGLGGLALVRRRR
ncbi:PEP-CTERM sorting domain-containing protein [Planctomycetales bacterium ZRK34]|nr:PEP-CTERM sorting domain-containing protein [Planctomycetales bacterium ZRK34]